MFARSLTIEEKHRQFTGQMSSMADFSVSEGKSLDAEIILRNPNISLHFLDDVSQHAVFVELPPGVDLASAPFVYQMQYEQALRLIAVPYDTFRALAQTLPKAQHLILIFSAARSGSTLLSHIFNRLGTTLSLSEPDVASQFVHMRSADGSRDTELRDLIDCTVRMLFKPNAFKTPTTCAIKFRSEATPIIDLYYEAFPEAKSIYLYRDAIGYVASFYRLFRLVGFPESMTLEEYFAMMSPIERSDFRQLQAYLDPDADQITVPQQVTLIWLSHMERYLAQHARGIPMLTMRYEDLNQKRKQALSTIFNYCGLPVDQVAQTLSAFEGDSQAGTILAREKPNESNSLRLTEEQIAEIKTILSRHPVINTPDFVLPGTLQLD